MNQRDAKAARIRGSWAQLTSGEKPATPLPKGGEPAAGGADARGFLKERLALPVRDVAKLLGVSTAAVRLMIHRGDLPGKKVGGGLDRITYIVPTGALLAWLDAASAKASEGAA